MPHSDWLQKADIELLDTLVSTYIVGTFNALSTLRHHRGHLALGERIHSSGEFTSIWCEIDRIVSQVRGSESVWRDRGAELTRQLAVTLTLPDTLIGGVGEATFIGCVGRYVVTLGSRQVGIKFA